MTGTDAFDPNRTRTYLGGLHLGYDLTPDLGLGMAYYRGYTRTNGHTDVLSFTDIQREALSFNMTYRLKKARVGLDLTSPLRIRRGNALFDMPVGRHPTENIAYYDAYQISMADEHREYDLSLFWQDEVHEDWRVRAQMGMRLNPEGRAVTPDYFTLLGLNIKY